MSSYIDIRFKNSDLDAVLALLGNISDGDGNVLGPTVSMEYPFYCSFSREMVMESYAILRLSRNSHFMCEEWCKAVGFELIKRFPAIEWYWQEELENFSSLTGRKAFDRYLNRKTAIGKVVGLLVDNPLAFLKYQNIMHDDLNRRMGSL